MKCVFVVGWYELVGNLIGMYRENVLKGIFDCVIYCFRVVKKDVY